MLSTTMCRLAPLQVLGRLSLVFYLVHEPVWQTVDSAQFLTSPLAEFLSPDPDFILTAMVTSICLAGGLTWAAEKIQWLVKNMQKNS